MPAPRDRVALIKAARMCFLDGRSQDDIARVLVLQGRTQLSQALAQDNVTSQQTDADQAALAALIAAQEVTP